MSFADGPNIPLRIRLGCISIGLLGAALSAFLLVGAAMGNCAPNVDGTGCENEGLIKFAMFPGSLIVLIVAGLFMAYRVTKDRD